MVIFGLHAVVAHTAQGRGEGVVIGDDHAPIPHASEIFAGEKGETAGESHGAGLFEAVFAGVGRADGLGGVFDDGDVVLIGYGEDRVHVGALSEEVDGHDGFDLVVFIGIVIEPLL